MATVDERGVVTLTPEDELAAVKGAVRSVLADFAVDHDAVATQIVREFDRTATEAHERALTSARDRAP